MTEQNDPRSDSHKVRMAEHFADHREQYNNGTTHEIVYEDDEVVIVADHRCKELDQWTREADWDLGRDEFQQFCRVVADNRMGEQEAHEIFSSADPIVFDKFE